MLALGFLVTVLLFSGCSSEQVQMVESRNSDFRAVALSFTRTLAARDYTAAYAMTSREFRSKMSAAQMQSAFETIVPLDWGAMDPIEAGETMTNWPAKQPSDLGWVYVSVGGDVYSEAVIVIVTLEDGEPRVREVEFGRP